MKFARVLAFLSVALISGVAHAAPAAVPALDLETKIAYGQGRFAALYERCGSHDERAFIGGSVANWRTETFRGYAGNVQERAQVEQAFDAAVSAVAGNADACVDWNKQAAATWAVVAQLAGYGKIVASN